MNCLKCGKVTTNEQIFCDDCLQVMAQHPVKPGTPVYLPQREGAASPKKPSRKNRQVSAEEQVKELQKRNRRLWRWLTAVSLVLILLIGLLIWQFLSGELQPGFLSIFKR